MATPIEYTLYQNDKKIMYGTLKEIAEALGKHIATVQTWKTRELITREGYRVEEILAKSQKKNPKGERKRNIVRSSSGLTIWS